MQLIFYHSGKTNKTFHLYGNYEFILKSTLIKKNGKNIKTDVKGLIFGAF